MEACPGEREQDAATSEAWEARLEMECRRWRRLALWFAFLALCFVGVSLHQARTIEKQRVLIRQMFSELYGHRTRV